MLARQAEEELAATASWGDEMKKTNEILQKKTTRQNFRINPLNTSVKQLQRSLAIVESTRKPFDPAHLKKIVEEGVKDNLRPRQAVEESEQESKEGGEEGGESRAETTDGKRKNKRGRRKYGLASARLVEKFIQAGTPLVQVGALIKETVNAAYGVELDGKTKFTGTTAKTLALGISHLDKAELIKAILAAPYL
ncbi:unnamed protein product, partial [Ectocarpus fasciculatus]